MVFFESLKGELNQYPHIHICDLYPAFLDTPGIQHAANYTGKYLKPAPPVYDPRKVARAILSLINHPQSKTTIGAASGFLRLAYYLFPTLSRNITAAAMRTYLKQAHSIENTSGNVLHFSRIWKWNRWRLAQHVAATLSAFKKAFIVRRYGNWFNYFN